ncbi:MAG: ATPase, partial [Pseudoalteromonas sp.]
IVFETAEKNDLIALAIVKEGADYINQLSERLLEIKPPRLSIIGGLAEPLSKWLDPKIVKLVKPPVQPPEMGAIYFAQQSVLKQYQEVTA